MNDELRPRRTWRSTNVYCLPGGNEDNDLWTYSEDGRIVSTWVPTDEQRERIAAGGNIDLHVWGAGMPPVALTVNDRTPLGKMPEWSTDD